MKGVFVITALAALLAAPAAAEVQLQSIAWQLKAGRGGKPAELTQLSLPPGSGIKGRLRARVKLLNRGEAMEGVLLRYALTAQLTLEGDAAAPPQWAIAFDLDERRVPKIGANQVLEATIDPTQAVSLYLKRVHREGYWPKLLKLEVMLSPRKGDGPLQIIESTLPVGEAK